MSRAIESEMLPCPHASYDQLVGIWPSRYERYMMVRAFKRNQHRIRNANIRLVVEGQSALALHCGSGLGLKLTRSASTAIHG